MEEKKLHSPVFDAKSKTSQPNTKHGESQRLLRQSRRLDQAACLLTLLEHNPKADPRQRKKWMENYGTHLGAMSHDIDHSNAAETGFQNFVDEEMVSFPARLLQLKMSAKHYHKRYLDQNGTYLNEVRKTANDEISKHPLGKKTFQKIKGAVGSELKALKRKVRGPNGQTAGTPLTHMRSTKSSLMLGGWCMKGMLRHTKI